MIFNLNIPKNSKIYSTSNVFGATYNMPTVNRYDFTNVQANKAQHVIKLVNTSVYLIESLSFSSTIPQGDFLAALDTSNPATFPQWRLRFASDRTILHALPFPVVQYFDMTQFSTFFWSKAGDDFLDMDFSGTLKQTSELVGIIDIRAQVSLTIYEIIDGNFVKAFQERSAPGFFKV